MARKILLSLDDVQEKRLLDLVASYRSKGTRVTFSDVLRQGLFCLPVQLSFPSLNELRCSEIGGSHARS